MTSISEIMTRDAVTIAPSETMQAAAKMMDDLNVGSLPVCDGQKLVGMLTDRDIVVRGVSAGMGANAAVESLLSAPVTWCYEDDDVSKVQEKMAREQIRRLPVVDREKHLVGIVALGDLATNADGQMSSTVAEVSSPSQPDR
ncbi:CBS domain-containing protein [Caballeronia sp. LZ065]|uniref:CBS domain-containing protein n=1 Tax=Caballeronia sp. LZ065 TaxID=3038571 RepID=UPI00285CB2C8|nr:CBS domain-containing protein [Caballeronia sp. LZ065]MDR5781222.1 CBS domain-containing protein [Caballeronia sp. LZ065]